MRIIPRKVIPRAASTTSAGGSGRMQTGEEADGQGGPDEIGGDQLLLTILLISDAGHPAPVGLDGGDARLEKELGPERLGRFGVALRDLAVAAGGGSRTARRSGISGRGSGRRPS